MSGPQETLEKLGIPLDTFDPECLAQIDALIADLEPEYAALKAKHFEVKAERQVVTDQIKELAAARAYYVHEVRSPQEGDVVAGVPPIGGDNDS